MVEGEISAAPVAAAGGLGLFLLGMVVLTTGLEALAGASLARFLARSTRSPLSGATTGTITTAVLQSSSATTVAAVGFAGAGLLSFPQALGIIFGANLGTTVTGWLVALLGFKVELAAVAGLGVLVGALLRLFAQGRAGSVGMALAGFGLILLGIDGLKEALTGLEGYVTPATFPRDTYGGRLLLIASGALLTVVTQSSSAGVATALAALHAGTITFPQAAALVIGMDLGTSSTALVATLGGSLQARRTGFAHMIFNLFTAVGAYLLLDVYPWAVGAGTLAEEPELALVGFHTLFNALSVLLVLPFAGGFARLIERLLPDRDRGVEGLDARVLEGDPAVAVEAIHAAVTGLVPRVFAEVTLALEHGTRGAPLDRRLDPFVHEADAVADVLARVRTTPERADSLARIRGLVHTLDHLGRFLARARRDGPEVEAEPDVAAAAAWLAEVLSGISVRPGREDVAAAESCWKALHDRDERYRREMIARSARGEVEVDEALTRLDETRHLRRLAYHAWRIVAHLAETGEGGPAVSAAPTGRRPR